MMSTIINQKLKVLREKSRVSSGCSAFLKDLFLCFICDFGIAKRLNVCVGELVNDFERERQEEIERDRNVLDM